MRVIIHDLDTDYEKSLNYANKAINNNSKDGFAHYRKGIALYNMKDYIN